MLLAFKIKSGHSADVVMVDNVVECKATADKSDDYVVTYKDPNKNNELFDIVIKHVETIKEV